MICLVVHRLQAPLRIKELGLSFVEKYQASTTIRTSPHSFFDPSVCSCSSFSPGAAMQTQGYSDAFQRTYPSYELAEAAWIAYTRDGTYPDYGRGPWVVFHGRKPGVFERV